jgi:VIT1/CCC1 family predicted Fe2+/Mn2+ transporter
MKQKLQLFKSYFKEVIYGGIDGIVTTFAVVAGFSGAALSTDATGQLSFVIVLLFGLANLFADAASMGLGNFLSVRSEKDLYNAERRQLLQVIREQPGEKQATTVQLLEQRGFSTDQAKQLAALYADNETFWLDFMMAYEQDMVDPRGEHELYTGLTTFASFMIFGAIPLIPFVLQTAGTASLAFLHSIAGTLAALIILGLLKWWTVGGRARTALTEVLLVGGTAASLAYLVGSFFAV